MGQYTQGKNFYNFIKEYGVRTLFFVKEQNGEPIIGTLCYKFNPYLLKFWGENTKFLMNFLNGQDKFSFWNNHLGFVFNSSRVNKNDFIAFIDSIKQYKMKFGERFYIESFIGNNLEVCNNIINLLSKIGIKGKIIGTTRIDIENIQLQTLKKELRTDIKYGEKSILSIKTINKNNIYEFTKSIYIQFKSSYQKNHIAIPSYNYYTGIIISGAELFLVYKDNQLLGGDYIYADNGIALAMSTFTTENGYKAKLRSGEYLRRYIINYLKDKKIKYFDLNMIAVNGSEKQNRINFYKLKRGGEIIYGINCII